MNEEEADHQELSRRLRVESPSGAGNRRCAETQPARVCEFPPVKLASWGQAQQQWFFLNSSRFSNL